MEAYENSILKVLLYTWLLIFYLLQKYLDYSYRWHWTTRMYRLHIREYKLVLFNLIYARVKCDGSVNGFVSS